MKYTIRNYYIPTAVLDTVRADAIAIAGGATVWHASGAWSNAGTVEHEPVAVVHVLIAPAYASTLTRAVADTLARHGESAMAWSSGTAGTVESLDALADALDGFDALDHYASASPAGVDALNAQRVAALAAFARADAALDPDPVDPVDPPLGTLTTACQTHDDGRGMPGTTARARTGSPVADTLTRREVLAAMADTVDYASSIHDHDAVAAVYTVAGHLGLADDLAEFDA